MAVTEDDGVKISEFPSAPEISSSDLVTGLHDGDNANFTFSRIMAWFRDAVTAFFVPNSRKVNGKALSSDISLTASDVGARANDWTPTAAQVGARPDTWTPSAQDVGAVPVASVGVAGGVPNLDEIGKVPAEQLPPYVPPTREVNGHDLSSDITLTAADVGAAPAKSILRFTDQAVSAGTSQQILSVSNADITADHVLARIEFQNRNYITAGYTWETTAGSFKLTGTATAATTANVLLVRKGN